MILLLYRFLYKYIKIIINEIPGKYFYFFIPIIFSYSIYESFSFYHTFSLFVGALFIFYPMHLAGLAGMARRVPEYADLFIPFITIGLHGTILLIFSTITFIRSYFIFLSHIQHKNYT